MRHFLQADAFYCNCIYSALASNRFCEMHISSSCLDTSQMFSYICMANKVSFSSKVTSPSLDAIIVELCGVCWLVCRLLLISVFILSFPLHVLPGLEISMYLPCFVAIGVTESLESELSLFLCTDEKRFAASSFQSWAFDTKYIMQSHPWRHKIAGISPTLLKSCLIWLKSCNHSTIGSVSDVWLAMLTPIITMGLGDVPLSTTLFTSLRWVRLSLNQLVLSWWQGSSHSWSTCTTFEDSSGFN